MPRVNFIRAFEHRFIRFEDFIVQIGVTVDLFGNGTQSVARLNGIKLAGSGWCRRFHLIIDTGNTGNIPHRNKDFLLRLLTQAITRDRRFAVGDLNVHFIGIRYTGFVQMLLHLLRLIVFIVLTCNIVTGIMIGFATLVIGRLVSGEWRKLNIGTVVIAVALVTFYAGGWAI